MWHDTDRTKPPYWKKIVPVPLCPPQKYDMDRSGNEPGIFVLKGHQINTYPIFIHEVRLNVIGKLNSCLTGNTICLEHTHGHTLMRYETTAFVLWIINALLGGKRNRSFSLKASGTHTTLPYCTQLITTLRY